MDALVDTVVVTYNSAHVIGALLDSLPAAMSEGGEEGARWRTVVVDNGSTDETLAVLSGRTDCEVVAADNRGYAAGINRGVEHLAGTGPVLVLNPDVRLAPGAVPALLRTLALPGTGIVAPRVLDDDGALFRSLRREPTLLRATGLGRTEHPLLSERLDEPSDYEAARVVDWALGAALLVSRECHDRLGGWDESFFLYSEETDFCLRARDLGLATRYEPSAVVTHIGGQSGQSARIHAMQILNRVRLYRRRHGPAASWVYFTLALASEASWVARGRSRSREAIASLLRPSRRPHELGCSDRLVPR